MPCQRASFRQAWSSSELAG